MHAAAWGDEEMTTGSAFRSERRSVRRCPMTPSTLYAVWPDRDHPGTVILAIADEGATGHAQIAAHFPNLNLALDGNELLHSIASFKKSRTINTWQCLLGGGIQILFVVIIDGKPVEKIIVRAKSMAEAIKHAHRAYKKATFMPIGALEQYRHIALRMVNLLDGSGREVDLDLRGGAVEGSSSMVQAKELFAGLGDLISPDIEWPSEVTR